MYTCNGLQLKYIEGNVRFSDRYANVRHYSPGMTYAILSNVLLSDVFRCPTGSSMPGMNVVRHISGPSEHNKLSNNTDKLPETVICPCETNR